MNPQTKLKVRNIIGAPVDGYSRVTVNTELFDAIRQSAFARYNRVVPMLRFTQELDGNGKFVSTFIINGTEICHSYDKASRSTLLLMKTEDANRFLSPLADDEKKAFKLSSFLVATA